MKGHQGLERVIADLRAEPMRPVDWERVEQALLERVSREVAERRRQRARWAVAGSLVAGAGLAWFLLGQSTTLPVPSESEANTSRVPLAVFSNPDEPSVGAPVVADVAPVAVEHPGRAVWTLLPGSRAHIAERGRYLTVVLEQGAIEAAVVPGQPPESFSVEAAGVRVASHGTRFRVRVTDSRVEVAVSLGEVVVGSVSERGHTEGTVLSAFQRGTFRPDGTRVDETAVSPQARPPVPGASRSSDRAARLSIAPPPTSAPPSVGLSAQDQTEQIVTAIRACFVAHTDVPEGVHVSATTRLTLQFAPGRIAQMRFDPPLAPPVERCSRDFVSEVGPLPHPPSTEVRELWLSR